MKRRIFFKATAMTTLSLFIFKPADAQITYLSGAGTNNCTVGAGATGVGCTFVGCGAGFRNGGDRNNAFGHRAFYNNLDLKDNIAIGDSSLISQTVAGTYSTYNIAIGNKALYTNNPSGSTTGINNNAVGHAALFSNTTGTNNNAFGFQALYSNTTGYANVAFGTQAVYSCTTGVRNIGIGDSALFKLTSSNSNTAVGYQTLYSLTGNTSGASCAFGHKALYSLTTNPNDAFGYNALTNCSTGVNNVAVGYGSLQTLVTNSANTGLGSLALFNNVSDQITAAGCSTLYNNTTGTHNTACGYEAGMYNQTGSDNSIFGWEAGGVGAGALNSYSSNSFFGSQAGFNMKTTSDNVAVGYQALYTQNYSASALSSGNVAVGNLALKTTNPTGTTNGYRNTGLGYLAGRDNSTGAYNTFVGCDAGMQSTTGTFNAFVGYQAGYIANTDSSALVGYKAGYVTTGKHNTYVGGVGAGSTNTTGYNNSSLGSYAGGNNTTDTLCTFVGYGADANGNYKNSAAIGANTVVTARNKMFFGDVNVLGCYNTSGLWTSSDGRFKNNVTENVKGLAFINKLRPVTYNLNTQALDDYIIQGMPDSAKTRHKAGMDYRASTAKVRSGFIAQEVEQTAQQVGFTSSIVSHPSSGADLYAINYAEIVVPLVKAVQELSKQVDSLKAVLAVKSTGARQIQNGNNGIGGTNPAKGGDANQTVSAINVELSDINAVVLDQNVPNPFAEQTIITYNIPATAALSQILFYDVNGNLFKVVDIKTTGKGQLNVFANDLTSGIYSYTLVVDGKIIDTKKMMKQ